MRSVAIALSVLGCLAGGAGVALPHLTGPAVSVTDGAPVPPFAVQRPASQPNMIKLAANSAAQFWVTAKANGVELSFLVDTGAGGISFNKRDAQRIGLDPARLKFDMAIWTANGITHGAVARLERLELGPFVMTDLPVTIIEGDLRSPLLGMTVLKRLDVAISNGTLTLRQ